MTWRLALAFVFAACSPASERPEVEVGALEVGLCGEHDADGACLSFVPLADGDTTNVVLGPNALNMIVPSLRASGIDPRAPDPTVLVTVADLVMAADIEGAAVDMQPDGDADFVLYDLRVPFQTELCCYVCRDGLVEASITDASGRTFEGRVTINLARAGCPDPTACCGNPEVCPDPSLTLVCE